MRSLVRCCLVAALAWLVPGQTVHGAESPAPLSVGAADRIVVGPQMEVLFDPAGALDLAGARAAHAAGRFGASPSAVPAFGFHPGAVWLRFAVVNPGPAHEERWLELGWPLLQSAELSLVGQDGRVQVFQNGARVPVQDRPVASRQLLFPIALAPQETATAYLRLSSRSSLVADLALWRPAAYADARELRMAVKYLAGGATLIVVVYSVLAWRARRRPALLGAGAAQLCLLAIGLTLEGIPGGWLAGGDGVRPGQVVNALPFLMLAFDAFFAREFLRLADRHPRLDAGVQGIAWLSLPLALLPFVWPAFAPISAVWLAGIVLLTAAVVVAGARGDAAARAYLAAWGLLWLGIIVREVGVFGWLAHLPFVSDLPIAGVYASAFAVSYALHLELRKVRDAAQVSAQRLLELEQGEKERLRQATDAATAALRGAVDQAEAGSRAKSTFLSTVSHELRTPLHTLLGYTRMLRDRTTEDETRQPLEVIEKSGRQLLRLIDELLDYTRGDLTTASLQVEPISLRGLAAHLAEAGQLLAAERGNRLRVAVSDGVPDVVEADERRLTQVLQNLVGNACKFTDDGEVRLTIERDAAAQLAPQDDGGTVHSLRFTVADTGIGIASDDQQRVFEPFARGADGLHRPGIGLGLPIARQLVRAMGSDIAVDSAPTRGSRFSFTLRLRDAGSAVVATPTETLRIVGYTGPRRRLLIVDDVPENRLYLASLFEAWGFDVVTAVDGADGLRCCREAAPRPDAALVDQVMPVLDGWGFLRAVRESPDLADLPVALISAGDPEPPAGFPESCRFDEVFLKPVNQDALGEWLRQRLGLEWTRAAPSATSAAEEMPLSCPGAERLRELRELLTLGRIVALKQWARDLARAEPRHGAFARRVEALCKAVDLKGLQRLLDHAEGTASR